MNQQQRYTYLSAMGITVWQQRNKKRERLIGNTFIELVTDLTKTHQPVVPTISPPTEKNILIDCSTLDWPNLQKTVATCQQCSLTKTRNQAILGKGNHHASLMIIGDAPADDEDRQGLPFAGKAAQLLANMLNAIDIPQQNVYFSNLIKCRPPNNRTPYKKELTQCKGFIQQQIKLIKPDLILVIGRVAAQQLLQSTRSLAQLRNKIHQLEPHNIPIIVTYHPTYLLRQTSTKAKVWQDLKKVREHLSSLNKHN